VIDLSKINFEEKDLHEDIEIKFGSEPWWFSAFWRKASCSLILSWNIVFFVFAVIGYRRYVSSEVRPKPSALDKFFLKLDKLDMFKDSYYLFFKDHTTRFFLMFANSILVPLFITAYYNQKNMELAFSVFFGGEVSNP